MTYCHRDGCLTAHLRSCSRIILPNYITYTQHVSRLVDMQPQAGSDLHDGAPHGKVFNQQSPKPNPFVYLSNLSVDAYEGAIRKAFEKEGIHVANIQLLQKGSFNRKHNSGLATVQLVSAADAERCCELLDGKVLHTGADPAGGRPMIVRRNKFVESQLNYDGQHPEQPGSSSDADS